MKTVKSINFITLGCAKNRVDSEHIAHNVSNNYQITFDREDFGSEDFYFDVVVINTCGFILDAKTESIDAILMACVAKREGKIGRLYVMGCLSQRYQSELRSEIPDVDEYFGARDFTELKKALEADNYTTGRMLSTPQHTAYLKIAEGCNWGCGYCAIPLIRGAYRSVPMEELIAEAKWLAERGTKELVVIAQDTTYYGMDIYGKRRLAELLTELCKIEGVEWIRLQYGYPAQFPRDVIEVMAREEKICNYLDLPFQHISDNVLSAMRRGLTKAQTLDLIEELRQGVEGIALRTTLLVGYPGESEADFEELCEFVKQMKFERLGVFGYSAEEGTYSAEKLDDNLTPEQKEERVARIMRIQEGIAAENSARRVGQTIRVLFDRVEGDYLVGRSQWDSLDVDGEVLVHVDSLEYDEYDYIGTFENVAIASSDTHDVFGTIV